MSAEFDEFARGYDAAMDHPLKRIAGSDQDDFLRPKVEKLLELCGDLPKGVRFLDFGCGTGDFLRLLRDQRPDWSLSGTDISQGMLDEAKRRSTAMESVKLFPTEALEENGRYDVIAATCVFHHIPPTEWPKNFALIQSLLNPRGRFFLFEHNPWNPLTQLVVRFAEIDRNAVLLQPPLSAKLMRAAGFHQVRTEYLMFVPPRFASASRINRVLRSVPLGAQYVVSATVQPS